MYRHFLFDVGGAILFQNSTKEMFVQYQQEKLFVLWGVHENKCFTNITVLHILEVGEIRVNHLAGGKFAPFSLKAHNDYK